MLSIFQSSLPTRIILLLVIWLALTIASLVISKPIEINHFRLLLDAQKVNEGLVMYDSIFDFKGIIPIYINALVLKFSAYNGLVIKIIASILIFSNAIYFNSIVDKYRLISERSFVPGLICLIFSFSFYQSLELSSILLGNIFITLGISALFKIGLEGSDLVGKSFNAGAYFGLAFLCDQIFIIFLIVGFIALQYYTRKGAKTYINLVLGFTFPGLIILIIYLFFGIHDDFLTYYFVKYFSSISSEGLLFNSTFLPWLILSFIILIFFIYKRSSLSFKNYISKAHLILIFWLFTSVIAMLVMKDRELSGVYLLANPVSFFATFYFNNSSKKWLNEVLFLVMIIFALSFNFLIDKNPLVDNQIINSALINIPTEKYDGKVLFLEDKTSTHTINEHGSSFTNWDLEKKTFLNLVGEGNLEKVYLGITNDYPKYIVDPNGIFDRIMDRVPLFRKKYKKVDSKTYRFN